MMNFLLIPLLLVAFEDVVATPDINDPSFSAPIANITVPVGREAIMTCIVHDLASFKVAFLRVDTQTILTIQSTVITKNHRIGITHTENRIWQLRIKDVRESDRGWYMCQINTDPMKSQVGYLDVVVPPDILDYPTSQDMIVREGYNVSLHCAAVGSPEPTITWRRERGKPLLSVGSREIFSAEGPSLMIPRVNRHHMGAYLCIASNGIPPTVSKRIMVIVNFPPTIWVRHQSFFVAIGQKITLECITESHPNSVNYWLRGKGDIVQGGSYEQLMLENVFKVVMKLVIRPVKATDFGIYKCIAKNSLGESEETISVHHKSKPVDLLAYHQPNHISASFANSSTFRNSDWNLQHFSHSCTMSSFIPRSFFLVWGIFLLS
ncbi:neurotrimin-like isoform X1 [Phlebotomus papatasi]|uniref:neurotrimin-like isoform X1 n=2 Tax=Phlebotomus papatasi TaxID=29031 RepID=UPI002483F5F7|nr:neurotrimin-like isoform X1 [Phlebotomus papatasi]